VGFNFAVFTGRLVDMKVVERAIGKAVDWQTWKEHI
jgi:hypothetical protein